MTFALLMNWAKLCERACTCDQYVHIGVGFTSICTFLFHRFSTEKASGYRDICINLEVGWTIESESENELAFVTVEYFGLKGIRTHICEVRFKPPKNPDFFQSVSSSFTDIFLVEKSSFSFYLPCSFSVLRAGSADARINVQTQSRR